ncbi:hypothetical protein [Candidatus Viridilinea mediisalina]|uniref:Lipoprotein n=1 Tax=Candidatus Viridilinea mediisalina TaxID=2024553 RepID=A0A2A6RNV9_9CHLR|nr:hypothetical protein [Candidatus Viridilinea mediisalina]PDW04633.1 hypothetical protein CJ255_02325 [Candidatus Viridilinea mediisalina]
MKWFSSLPYRMLRALMLITLMLFSLTGCLLVSGEATALDVQEGAGNLLTRFVGAEGRGERSIALGLPATAVHVIAIVGVESGDLELSFVEPDGAVAFVVAAHPGVEVTHSGVVYTDEAGMLRYRLNAYGARNGNIQLFVQP